jgi:hypothetical protein
MNERKRNTKKEDKMAHYRIFANGTDMGTYEGLDEDAALDSYAQDAGYADYDSLLEEVPGSTRGEVEVREATQDEIDQPYV